MASLLNPSQPSGTGAGRATEIDESCSKKLPDAYVAVVFVHGMGEQEPGNMLAEYMNPSLEWIKRAATDDHHSYAHGATHLNLYEGVNILERDRSGKSADPNLSTADEATAQGASTSAQSQWLDIEVIHRGLLKSAQTSPATFQPPYVDVEFKGVDEETKKVESRRLVAVEAWWAKEFDAPSFKAVAQWGLGVAPAIILRQIALLWETPDCKDATSVSPSASESPNTQPGTLSEISASRTGRMPVPQKDLPILRWLKALCVTPLIGVVGILVQWLICMLMLLSPIPFLRKYIGAIVLKLTSSLGDVLTYVHDGVRSAAIRSTVLRSFAWLFSSYNVRHLIVVAHSLGSVVSYDILSTRNLKVNEETKKEIGGDVTFVTFGSPLKRVNVILQLKRDEQRIALGMLYASLSFFAAILALICGANHMSWTENLTGIPAWPGDDPLLWQAGIAIMLGFGMLALGFGAHARPTRRGLSRAQWAGVILLGLAFATGGVVVPVWGWRFLILAPLGGFFIAFLQVSRARRSYADFAGRPSPTGLFGLASIVLLLIVSLAGVLPAWTTFIVLAVIFSVLSGSTPLEEFNQSSKDIAAEQDLATASNPVVEMEAADTSYRRQYPLFSFRTPLSRWIDFWASKDLVAEFGLSDVWYRIKSPNTEPGPDTFGTPVSRRVTNQSSLFSDHTSYSRNTEQFIAPLTRLFLEKLSYRPSPSAAVGTARFVTDPTPVGKVGHFEEGISRLMGSRSRRFSILGWFSLVWFATFMLLSPGVARSLGEFIVFNTEAAPGSVSADAPNWFTSFYNEDEKVCPDANGDCPIRSLPLVPADLSRAAMENPVVRGIILYGLGYAIIFAIASLVRTSILTTPWRAWESALLDRVLQAGVSKGKNLTIRRGVFFLSCSAIVLFALWLNSGFLDFWNPESASVGWIQLNVNPRWLWDARITPLQTGDAVISVLGRAWKE